MADNPIKYGFRWKRSLSGSCVSPPTITKRVASGYQGNPGAIGNIHLAPGDPVKLVSDGTITHASPGDAIYGIVAGIGPFWDGTKMVFNKVLTGGQGAYGTNYSRESRVEVIPVANQVFEVDCDDASTATTYAAYVTLIENNADFSWNRDSNTLLGNPRLDISDNKTATAQCRILDVMSPSMQDFTGNYVKVEVTFTEVQQSPYTAAGV